LIAARAFCNVDGRIGLCEQRFAPDSERVARGDADAARHIDRFAESADAYLRDAFHDALRNGSRRGGIGAAQDHDKLFAAVAADDIGLAQFRVNGIDDGAQARIARLMPEGVVDLFEVIKIDEQQRYRQTARSGASARGIEPFDQ